MTGQAQDPEASHVGKIDFTGVCNSPGDSRISIFNDTKADAIAGLKRVFVIQRGHGRQRLRRHRNRIGAVGRIGFRGSKGLARIRWRGCLCPGYHRRGYRGMAQVNWTDYLRIDRERTLEGAGRGGGLGKVDI